MEGDQESGYGFMSAAGDDIAIPIPLLVPVFEGSRVSDSGEDSRTYSFSKVRATTGTTMIRRRNSAPNSTKSQPNKRSTYYQTKSKVLKINEPRSESSNNPPPETNPSDPDGRSSLHEKIKAMKSGILLSEKEMNEDDSKISDEKDDDADDDDDDSEEAEKNGSGNVGNDRKPRKCSKLKIFVVFMQLLLFSSSLILLIVSLKNDHLQARLIWGSEIWRWCALVLVIICGWWVTRLARACIVVLIETKFLFNEKAVYYVHGVNKSVRFAVWVSLVLAAWVLLIDKSHGKRSEKTSKNLDYTRKFIVSALMGAIMWMVKTSLVKFIAAKFHVQTFFQKIREAVTDDYVFFTLSIPRLTKDHEDGGGGSQGNANVGSGRSCWSMLPKWMRGRQKKDGAIEQRAKHEGSFTLKKLGRMKPGKMPASTLGHFIHRIRSSKLSFVSDPNLKVQKDITTRSEAARAASQIFKNLATNKDHPEYFTKGDLLYYENNQNKECLNEWFLKVAEEGKISETILSEWVVNMFKQREYLAHSLKDSKTAIEELSRIFTGVLWILIVIVGLKVMGFVDTKVLLLFSSQILLLGFIFGNTCKTLFDCLIFVFVSHPFDIGDRCVVDGVQMIVEEMDILKTAFLRYDNELIYYPNSVLSTKPISNFNRSPEKMGDSVLFGVDVSTPVTSIEALKAKIKMYVEEEKSHHWYPDHSLQIKDIEKSMDKIIMALYVNHRINFQDFGEKTNRRTELIMALMRMFEDVGIKYYLSSYSNVSVSAFPSPPVSNAYNGYRRAM